MNYVIIRTYAKDDYLARLCYESWRMSGYDGEIIFYCQLKVPPNYVDEYKPKFIKDVDRIVFHNHFCNNFAGTMGVMAMREAFGGIDFKDDDYIVSCDTDIVIKENPFNHIDSDIDLAGHGGILKDELYHIGGQCQIIKGRLLKEILKDDEKAINGVEGRLLNYRVQMCDDTYISLRVHQLGGKVKLLDKLWHHVKSYDYEPREDWDNIINHYKSY